MCVNSMGPFAIINLLLNFMAPAAAVALVLVLCAHWVGARSASAMPVWRQWIVVFVVGLLTLAAGLVVGGRDGKMLTYAALVVPTASCQWYLARSWTS